MAPPPRTFFVRGVDGLEYGPVDLPELRTWVVENRAGLGTPVRLSPEESPWAVWQDFPELVALVAEVQARAVDLLPPGLTIAPMGRRLLACALDLVLCFLLVLPVGLVLALNLPVSSLQAMEQARPNWFDQSQLLHDPALLRYSLNLSVLWYGGIVLYFAAFTTAHGRTPGKSILGLEVVGITGHRPTLVGAALRSLLFSFTLYAALLIPPLIFLPIVSTYFNPGRRALHDYVAETYVVQRAA